MQTITWLVEYGSLASPEGYLSLVRNCQIIVDGVDGAEISLVKMMGKFWRKLPFRGDGDDLVFDYVKIKI